MKTTLASLILFLGALALAGCIDASTAKRDDGKYVVVPINRLTGAPLASNEVHPVNATPGETGRKLSPDTAKDQISMIAVESPSQEKQRASQEKFEADLAKLDSE